MIESMQAFLDAWRTGSERPPISELRDARLLRYGGGTAEIQMEAGGSHHNAMGTVHGGILCGLADMAIGAALATSLEEGETFTTLDLHANFVRPAIAGPLVAWASLVRRGRRVALLTCRITNEEHHVAEFDSKCLMFQA